MIRRRQPLKRSQKPIKRSALKRSGKPIARNTAPNKRRSKPRRGKATPADKARFRGLVYARSGGICELNLSDQCVPGRLPWAGGVFERGHLVHLKSEGSGGATDEENCRWGCWYCHLVCLHRNEKPVPKKAKTIDVGIVQAGEILTVYSEAPVTDSMGNTWVQHERNEWSTVTNSSGLIFITFEKASENETTIE